MADAEGLVVLFGGPAGAGKSTLAAAWCGTRTRACHLQLDEVRGLIVAGRVDPQAPEDAQQREQYALSVNACLGLARVFASAGYDVAVDDVLEPQAFATYWRPLLDGLDWRVVVILPTLAQTLVRANARPKSVMARHSQAQHRRCSTWPEQHRIDTTGLSVDDSLHLVESRIGEAL